MLVNSNALCDNSTVNASESEILPSQTSTSSFTATRSTISSFSIDIDLEMPPPSTSNVVNETTKPATSLMKPATSRSIFAFADRISEKDQVSVVDYC